MCYYNWSYFTNSFSTFIWKGKIICGFKKIEIIWDCGPIEAYLRYKNGKRNLFNYLIDFLKQPDFQHDPIEDDIEETRLFK